MPNTDTSFRDIRSIHPLHTTGCLACRACDRPLHSRCTAVTHASPIVTHMPCRTKHILP